MNKIDGTEEPKWNLMEYFLAVISSVIVLIIKFSVFKMSKVFCPSENSALHEKLTWTLGPKADDVH